MPDETVTPAPDPAVAQLQQQLAERDAAFAPLKDELAALKAQVLTRELASAKDKLTAANPDIPPELITGDTPAALATSVTSARALVDKVKQQAAAAVVVPVGSGIAPAFDPFTLPPDERIKWGMENADKIQRTNVGTYDKNERR